MPERYEAKTAMVIKRVPLETKFPRRAGVADEQEQTRFDRSILLRASLVGGSLLIITVSACTVVFWFVASTTGFISLAESSSYLVRSAGLFGIMIGAVALFFVIVAFRRAALPIADLMEGTNRVANGDLEVQIQERGPREIRSLARAFNDMVLTLKERDAARRKLIADMGSELRPPLGSMTENLDKMLNGEAARDDSHIKVLLAETTRLSTLVGNFNTLAKAETGEMPFQREPTDIGTLVRDTLNAFHRSASAHSVALSASLPDSSIIANVDRTWIQEALGHVLVHALSCATSGGDISVDVSVLHSPERVDITVVNQGHMTSAEELSHFFESYDRGEGAGAGVGLAISKRFVEAHGGRINAWSDADRGTRVTISLPLSAEPLQPAFR